MEGKDIKTRQNIFNTLFSYYFNMIYFCLRREYNEAKNLMFNVYFYVDFFNYYLNFSRERFAAKIKV